MAVTGGPDRDGLVAARIAPKSMAGWLVGEATARPARAKRAREWCILSCLWVSITSGQPIIQKEMLPVRECSHESEIPEVEVRAVKRVMLMRQEEEKLGQVASMFLYLAMSTCPSHPVTTGFGDLDFSAAPYSRIRHLSAED